MNGRKRLAIVAGLVMALVGVMGTALAEGSFTSSISGGRVGFQSRRWNDRHLDGTSTTVRFAGCRDNSIGTDPNDNATVHLWRDIPFQFDEDRGNKLLTCWVAATGNWGVVPNVGDYYFQIDSISGGAADVIDVPTVNVRY